MKRVIIAAVMAIVLAGCGGNSESTSTTESVDAASQSSSESTMTAGAGCTTSGLDAMTALSDFELEMDAAQKAGKLTVDQLTASRDKLFEQTQAASAKEDWAAYCKAIDDMRAELKL